MAHLAAPHRRINLPSLCEGGCRYCADAAAVQTSAAGVTYHVFRNWKGCV